MSTTYTGDDKGDAGDSPGVLALIAKIQDGALSGKTMDVRDRRACVEHLAAEGYSIAETVGVLRVGDRTVSRDREANAETNALRHDPRLAGQLAGRLLREAETCISRMRRAVRATDTPAATKVDAEHRCFQVLDALAVRLQSLGFLPTAAHQVQASVAHSVAPAIPSAAEMTAELERLDRIRRDLLLPDRPELDQQFALARGDVAALHAHERVRQVTQTLEQEIQHERDDDRSR